MNARLQVRTGRYRGDVGYRVLGHDTHNRRVHIFCRREATARAIVAVMKAGQYDQVDKLLMAESRDNCNPKVSDSKPEKSEGECV